jgi:single-strand DNA-binding protein
MNDTLVTVIGNVATHPETRAGDSGSVSVRFRLATAPRRLDRASQNWVDGPTSFYTVWATRRLGENVAASLGLGEPVVVCGRLKVRETEADGRRFTSAEIDAQAIGHDLARGTSAFQWVRAAARPRPGEAPPGGAAPVPVPVPRDAGLPGGPLPDSAWQTPPPAEDGATATGAAPAGELPGELPGERPGEQSGERTGESSGAPAGRARRTTRRPRREAVPVPG